jgi:hypothetical protein
VELLTRAIAMGWNNDQHGLVFKPTEVKLYFNGGHTYKMKIGALSKSESVLQIMTYSLPDHYNIGCQEINHPTYVGRRFPQRCSKNIASAKEIRCSILQKKSAPGWNPIKLVIKTNLKRSIVTIRYLIISQSANFLFLQIVKIHQ